MNWGELDGWCFLISSPSYYYNIYGLLHKTPYYTQLLHNSPPHTGAYTSYMPNLLQMNCIRDLQVAWSTNSPANWQKTHALAQ